MVRVRDSSRVLDKIIVSEKQQIRKIKILKQRNKKNEETTTKIFPQP